MSKTNKLRKILENVTGASIITIDTETDVKLTGGKANPHQGRVTKQVFGSNVMVFSNTNTNAYENMVNRRLSNEGKSNFELSPRQWGERERGTPFVNHNGKTYLEVIFLKAGEVYYRLDGNDLPKDLVKGMPERSQEAEQGGLDHKVIIRTYAVESIISLTVDKKLHKL